MKKRIHWRRLIVNPHVVMAFFITCVVMCPFSAKAALIKYSLEFTDDTSTVIGTGSFLWDEDTEIMTNLNWNFSGKVGVVLDSALAGTYQSWNPLATTYGELYYRFLTDPLGYLQARNNPLYIGVGLMPAKVSGDFGFIAFGAEQGSTAATYLFYYPDWSVASEGYVSSTPVPEPASSALYFTGVVTLGAIVRQRKK